MRTALSLILPFLLPPAAAAPIEPVGGALPELGPALIGPATAVVPGGACAVEGSPAARVVGGVLSVDADAAPARLTVTAGPDCTPRAVFVHPPLTPPTGEATLFVEAGILEAGAEGLRTWRLGLARGELLARVADCPGASSCTLSLEPEDRRALLTGEARAILWPAALPIAEGEPLPRVMTADGPVPWPALAALPVRFAFERPVIGLDTLDVSGDRARIPLDAPELVADVRCKRARCALEGDAIRLYAVDRSALSVGVRIDLVDGAFRLDGDKRSPRENHTLSIVRCALRAPPVPLLAELRGHRMPVAMATDCYAGGIDGLAVEADPPTPVWIAGELPSAEPGLRVLDVVFDRVPARADRVTLRLAKRGVVTTVLGAVELAVASGHQPARVRLHAEGLGPVAFVPRNRPATVETVFDDAIWHQRLALAERPGFYRIVGPDAIQAVDGATGSVPLRFAYRPPEVAALVSDPRPLVALDTDARWPLRSVNIPLPLTEGTHPLVRVECRRGGGTFRVKPGRTETVPYGDRDACRLIIDRDAIPAEAGTQQLRIDAGPLDQVVQVEPRGGPLVIALPADGKREFDRLTVSVSHEYGQGHYDFAPRQNLGVGARYRVVLGDSPVRISASTSLPTGLFRFGGATEDKGAVALSAGAIARMTWLYKEGNEFPFGLEMGLFGTGLSSDPNLSLVAGVGFSVPVLNADTPLQTSFNLHAWFEYSPTRTGRDSAPWAFLFGPSFGVGKFSTNL